MSRIGRLPVVLKEGVKAEYKDGYLKVKGPKGELKKYLDLGVNIEIKDNEIYVKKPAETKFHKIRQGLVRSLINAMVIGVTEGFEKVLEINGIGYKASLDKKKLILNLGYSHLVVMNIPEGITVQLEGAKNELIKVMGIDKEKVGQFAANIRAKRPPEPYKGKGIRYKNEYIRRKAGKRGA